MFHVEHVGAKKWKGSEEIVSANCQLWHKHRYIDSQKREVFRINGWALVDAPICPNIPKAPVVLLGNL
jgi:hypothetical protein